MARVKKEYKKPTFHYSVRINNGEPVRFEDLPPEKLNKVINKLSDTIADALGYEPVK